MNAIEVENVTYTYPDAPRPALEGVSIGIGRGRLVAVMGEGGSGKSTLLRLLNGIIPHALGGRMEGRVRVLGHDTPERSVAWLSQRVGMVLENPDVQLFTDTVRSEVAFGPENLGRPRDEILASIDWALDLVGLKGVEDRPPAELSGGQKQRLAIAAVLATRPEVLVLDEPTSQIDQPGAVSIFKSILRLKDELGLTIVVATNDVSSVAEFADEVIVLRGGRIAGTGTPARVFSDETLASTTGRPQTIRVALSLYARGLPCTDRPVRFAECRDTLAGLFQRRC
ncbi:MAG: ATP-binding cassette domain-containing protein [Firmicutes bacterium]|nr:ATP-binding cassette domain-containing protein [Bacillota bacterium]